MKNFREVSIVISELAYLNAKDLLILTGRNCNSNSNWLLNEDNYRISSFQLVINAFDHRRITQDDNQ